MLLENTEKAPEISVTRQPIYNENEQTYAYELHFRNCDAEFSAIDDSNPASSQIIANVFMEIGLKLLVGDKLAFIKLPHRFILEKHSIPFAKDKFIMEIQANHSIDAELSRAISELHQQGFKVALDDFEYDDSKNTLIGQCDLIKIDFEKADKNILPELVDKLKAKNKTLLAYNVHIQENFEICKNMGFTLFQGNFLSEPKVVKYKTLPSNKLLLLEILTKTQDPDIEISELEELISKDVGISFKFLRLINSANFGLSQKVESLHQALMLLGMKEIKSWISLTAMSNLDSVPQEITNMSITRAKMCKSLAEKAGIGNPDTFFTVGMFSLLDVIMSKSMESILKSLPFSDEVNNALLRHEGIIGEALDCVIAHEQGDWNMIHFAQLTAAELKEIYIETLEWTRNVKMKLT